MTSFLIIGAGLGRTGTTSLKQALEELGYSPCHHMNETFEVQEHLNHLWKKLYYFNNLTTNDSFAQDDLLKRIFEGYVATVDCPGYMFYDRFLKWNPEAKLILTVRDSPEQYKESAQNTFFWKNKENSWFKRMFWKIVEDNTCPEHLYWINKYEEELHGVDPNHPGTDLALLYTNWINKVIRTVPADRLLIFNVKEGWKQLCEFLGKDLPCQPFPKKNSANDYIAAENTRLSDIMKTKVVKIFVFALVVVGANLFANYIIL